MKGRTVSIYLNEQRLAKLGKNPIARVRDLIDSIGEDTDAPQPSSEDTKTLEVMVSGMTPYMDTDQVLKATGVSRSTLDRAKANKEIKYYKRGRKCLYKIEDIREWIEGK